MSAHAHLIEAVFLVAVLLPVALLVGLYRTATRASRAEARAICRDYREKLAEYDENDGGV